jgi:hypothetical protein
MDLDTIKSEIFDRVASGCTQDIDTISDGKYTFRELYEQISTMAKVIEEQEKYIERLKKMVS